MIYSILRFMVNLVLYQTLYIKVAKKQPTKQQKVTKQLSSLSFHYKTVQTLIDL